VRNATTFEHLQALRDPLERIGVTSASILANRTEFSAYSLDGMCYDMIASAIANVPASTTGWFNNLWMSVVRFRATTRAAEALANRRLLEMMQGRGGLEEALANTAVRAQTALEGLGDVAAVTSSLPNAFFQVISPTFLLDLTHKIWQRRTLAGSWTQASVDVLACCTNVMFWSNIWRNLGTWVQANRVVSDVNRWRNLGLVFNRGNYEKTLEVARSAARSALVVELPVTLGVAIATYHMHVAYRDAVFFGALWGAAQVALTIATVFGVGGSSIATSALAGSAALARQGVATARPHVDSMWQIVRHCLRLSPVYEFAEDRTAAELIDVARHLARDFDEKALGQLARLRDAFENAVPFRTSGTPHLVSEATEKLIRRAKKQVRTTAPAPAAQRQAPVEQLPAPAAQRQAPVAQRPAPAAPPLRARDIVHPDAEMQQQMRIEYLKKMYGADAGFSQEEWYGMKYLGNYRYSAYLLHPDWFDDFYGST
jgi:hypothetical protein